jgi:hypothetical protein
MNMYCFVNIEPTLKTTQTPPTSTGVTQTSTAISTKLTESMPKLGIQIFDSHIST